MIRFRGGKPPQSGAGSKLPHSLSDLVNPIVIKELRQAVRGRFVVTLLVLSLIAQMITVIGAMIGQRIESTTVERMAVGGTLFTLIYNVLIFGTMILIPIYTGVRMMTERSDSNVDLLFITTIRPRNVILGKIFSSAALTALIFSAAVPFLMFSYVLRGIDFIAILYVTASGFFLVVSQSILAIFIGAIPASRPFKILLSLVVFFFTIGTAIFVSELMVRATHVAISLGSSSPWRELASVLGLIAALDVLMVFLSIALISPPSANRALPLRGLLTVLWLLSLGLAFWVMLTTASSDILLVWAILSMSLQTLVLFSAIGEREEWGPRVARTIPRALPKRLLAFVFYSGGGGTLWAIAMMLATVAAYRALAVHGSVSINANEGATWLFDGCACVIGYAGSALWLRRTLLAGRIPIRNTWAIVLCLFILLAVLPPLVALAADSDAPQFSTIIRMTTLADPFPVTSPPQLWTMRTVILGAWAAVVMVGNLGWLLTLFGRFKPRVMAPVISSIVEGPGWVEAR